MPDLRKIAARINQWHEGSPNTRELASDYRLVGLAGEVELARLLGRNPDLRVHGGDGGKDNFIWVNGRRFKVDAKTSRLPHLGMLVEADPPPRADVYVFFDFPDLSCWGWTWRAIVVKCPVVDKGHDLPSHEVPNKLLRDINKLLHRIDRR